MKLTITPASFEVDDHNADCTVEIEIRDEEGNYVFGDTVLLAEAESHTVDLSKFAEIKEGI